MKSGGVIAILLGVIIILGVVFKISIGFSIIVELLFAAIFIAEGLKVFRHFKGEHLGSLFFGAILFTDAFSLLPQKLHFWQIILLMIASYLVGAGLVALFGAGEFIFKSSKQGPIQRIENDFPSNSLIKTYMLNSDTDWTKFNLSCGNGEQAFRMKLSMDKDIFRMKTSYEEGTLNIIDKLKVSNVKVPERSNLELFMDKNLEYKIDSTFNVSDVLLDMRELNIKNTKLNTTATKISIVPTDVADSVIDMNIEISALTIKVPKDVSLVLNHVGDLTFKTLEGLVKREDGSYVSSNYSQTRATCYLNISSEMSRLNIVLI